MKVCHLAFNTFLPDARIYKEAESLAMAGHDVTVLAFQKGDLLAEEQMGPVRVRRLALSVYGGCARPVGAGNSNVPAEGGTARPSGSSRVRNALRLGARLLGALMLAPFRLIAAILRLAVRAYQTVTYWIHEGSNSIYGFCHRGVQRIRKVWMTGKKRMWKLRMLSMKQLKNGLRGAESIAKRTRLGKTAGIWMLQRSYRSAAVEEILRLKPDVIHAHDLSTLATGIVAARLVNAKLIYDAHEMEWESNRIQANWIMRLWWRFSEATLISAADAMVTVSPRIGELYRQRYQIPDPVILPNVPRASWMSLAPEVTLRDLIPDGANRRILLILGNVTADRGLPQAIESLRHLSAEYALVTLGNVSPPVREHLHQLAKGLGVGDRFFTLPPVHFTQVSNVAAGADVGFVLVQPVGTSYEYCMPNKLFELMHAGVPMVVGDLPDVTAVVNANRTGIVCDQQSAESIAAAVLAVQGDSQFQQSPAQEAIIRHGYSWEAFEPRLLQLYAVAQGDPRRRSRIRLWRVLCSPRSWWLAFQKGPHPAAANAYSGLDPAATISPSMTLPAEAPQLVRACA